LLKSEKKFIDKNNDEKRIYEREEQNVIMIKKEVKRIITVRRSTRIADFIMAF